MIFCEFLPHKGNFCWKLTSKVIYTSYLKHQKYPFCAPIFHLISETESYTKSIEVFKTKKLMICSLEVEESHKSCETVLVIKLCLREEKNKTKKLKIKKNLTKKT